MLLLESTAYDYFELLQQHTQLSAAMGEGGGPEQEGEAAEGHVSAAVTLHLCGQVCVCACVFMRVCPLMCSLLCAAMFPHALLRIT